MKQFVDPLIGLNNAQADAVKSTEGPVLVLAGAGSGKTRVLAHRIAYIVSEKLARPWQVLAVTFTNKAAGELKERVAAITPDGDEVAAGTFHSICLRLLRRETKALNYPRDFSIYDESDSLRLVKMILKEKGEDRIRPRTARTVISRLKNDLVSPKVYSETASIPRDKFFSEVYSEYEDRLNRNAAMDFDDLLIKPLDLFKRYPAVLAKWRERWRYLHVDEYQDTNLVQFELLKLLGGSKPNLFVVGDDDQSIYGWRGARVENIFNFRDIFKGTKVFRLEQNYRSTQPILDLAHSVVSKSNKREEKKLWTERGGGDTPEVVRVPTDMDEAREVVDRISRGVMSGKRRLSDYAILYRTNAQSRLFEDALRGRRLPYQVIGSLRFYDRKEVRDALAYFKLCLNPRDDVSLRRIIGEPPRGIGQTTLDRLITWANSEQKSMVEALQNAESVEGLNSRAINSCKKFGDQLQGWSKEIGKMDLTEWSQMVLDESGYIERLEKSDNFEDATRLDNIQELIGSIAEYSEHMDEEEGSLSDFLEQVALATDIDRYDPNADSVRLMTIHSAKGLEFPVVLVTGLEKGLFPLENGLEEDHDRDEERRLFYVAVTRAEDSIVLTLAGQRRLWGQLNSCEPSQFLFELEDTKLKGLKSILYVHHRDNFRYRDLFDDEKPASRVKSNNVLHGRNDNKSDSGYIRRQKRTTSSRIDTTEIPALRVGDLVNHKVFGSGIVVRTQKYAKNDLKVSIEFDDGVHHLLQSKAKLQPVKDI